MIIRDEGQFRGESFEDLDRHFRLLLRQMRGFLDIRSVLFLLVSGGIVYGIVIVPPSIPGDSPNASERQNTGLGIHQAPTSSSSLPSHLFRRSGDNIPDWLYNKVQGVIDYNDKDIERVVDNFHRETGKVVRNARKNPNTGKVEFEIVDPSATAEFKKLVKDGRIPFDSKWLPIREWFVFGVLRVIDERMSFVSSSAVREGEERVSRSEVDSYLSLEKAKERSGMS